MCLMPRWTIPLALSLTLVAGLARSQDAYVPEVLEPWVPWVLDEQEFLGCPALPGVPYGRRTSHVCAWPGTLSLDATTEAASFSQAWEVLEDAWVPLPGDERYWPLELTVDGRPAGAALREGGPAIYLRAGRRELAGRIVWDRRPASLAVPAATGLIALRVDGRTIASPRRETAVLWLGERAAAGEETPVLTARVYRRLADGRPQRLETRLVLDVAGPAREESLEAAVLPGFAATALSSELPARLDADGRLRLQVRPGTWEVGIDSRARTPLESLTVRAAPGGAAAEVWTYASWPALRVSTLEGGEPVDPAQAGVPVEWHEEPASRVLPGTTLQIDARPRDLLSEQANALRLMRRLWLDFDGRGFTGVDEVTGTMDGGWRLDLRPPFTMASARAQDGPDRGGPTYLQITAGEGGATTGVELRRHAPALTVVARVAEDAGGALPVTGYTQRFEQVSALLQLPAAYRLLWARGVDGAPGAWVNEWTLLDLFLLLLIAVAAGRLLGWAVGAVALVALAATFNEPGAPVYSWLNLVIALALIRAAPEGRLRRAATWYRNLSLAALVVLLVPFAIDQARQLIYPQLEQPAAVAAFMPPGAPPGAREPGLSKMPSAELAAEAPADELVVTARRREGGRLDYYLSDYQPPGTVPTGPGLPDWRWHAYRLSWNGPVEPDETMGLVIAGPWLVRLLRLLAIASSFALLGLLVGRGLPLPAGWQRWLGASPALLAAALIVSATASPPAQAADSAFPDAKLLDELRERLRRPPPCAPDCAQLEQATVRARGGELELRLRVHAQADVGMALPGRLDAWEPQRVRVGGAGEATVTRDRQGQLRLRLAPGVHDVLLAGPLPPGRTTVVWFPLPPRWVDVSVAGFRPDGLSGNRLLSGALELTPVEQPGTVGAARDAEVRIEPFVEVTRAFRLDREWTLETTVARAAPAAGAFTVEIDLLPGEAPTTAGLDLRNGKVLAAFGPDDARVGWTSVLAVQPEIALTAPAERPWQERWVFAVAPLWRAEFSGMTPLVRESDAGYWTPTFLPAGGETLRALLTRPTPIDGQTLAIDRVEVTSRPGQRSTAATLALGYRSTRGGQQAIRLPPGAKLQSARVDGESLPLRAAEDGRVDLPVSPGEHAVELEWSVDAPVAVVQRMPAIELGSAVSNIRMSLALPANRWVLFASGPRLGPAILYWSELAIFVVVALLLGRSGRTPLRTHQWLLLGLGFSTFAWPALVIFGAWLLAMHWRSQTRRQFSDWQFRVLQLGLALFAVVALSGVVSAIPQALLGSPDMSIRGFTGSSDPLGWFADQADGALPEASVLSVSIWYYKLAMLAWSLWLAFALVGWVRWAWGAYTRDGLWRGRVKPAG